MRLSLHYKLFGTILVAILLVVLYMTFVFQWSFDRGLLSYVNTVEKAQLNIISQTLTTRYKEHKNWLWLKNSPHTFGIIIAESYPQGSHREHILKRLKEKRFSKKLLPSGPLPQDTIPMHFFRRIYLADGNKEIIFGHEGSLVGSERIYYQNRVVGYLGAHRARYLSDSHQLVFAKQQKLALLLVAAAGILIAAGITFPLAYRLTQPIRTMAQATRQLALGRYDQRIATKAGGELGRLAEDLNDLATVLDSNRKARSQWIADISHELRTPLAILRGKIEGLLDGVYPPDKTSFTELHKEVMHLGRIVEDLYQLSLSDLGAMTYKKVETEGTWALVQVAELLRPAMEEKGLTLTMDTITEETVHGDNERLKQLFTNLLNNSLRYTDPGGTVSVVVSRQGEHLRYTFDDSGPGVSDEQLGKIFQRLFRGETSRSRKAGGAGLGLSICANIVNSHNGTITAHHSPLGGLRVEVTLPLT